ncbi:type II secretion system protein GspM [Caldimonas brevitalea]|uniref:General secretion pathway protein M n=1 Tax=Caldimonas brevitalea TaxID=413882 RepID=A0A0G3BJT5_9BURK|nr:type II secretion system protein GspM [Caldimonas brevitalea]AKJ29729.1 hypothetical protein AAW51_3038 [Caldimonas brevitalea]
MTPPRPEIRRLAAVGLLLLLMLSLWNLALAPLHRATAEKVDQLHDRRFELERLTALARRGAATTPEALQAERDELLTQLYSGTTDADVESRFIAGINALLQTSEVRLVHLKAGSVGRTGPLLRLSVDMQLAGTEAQLVGLLSALHHHRPRLIVDRAALVSPSAGAGVDTPAPELAVELRVAGFGLVEAKPTRATP